jgi:hypothetical protein
LAYQDQVKEILSKSGKNQSPTSSNNSKRSNSRNKSRNNNYNNNRTLNETPNTNGKGDSNNNNNNNKTRPQSAFKLKIDDLVDSVINKYTSGEAATQSSATSFINPIKVVTSSQSDAELIKRLLPTPQSVALASTTAPKQPAASPHQSSTSTSTSPLSVSSTSSVSRVADNLESLNVLNGAKSKGLEKSQKDLQRQIISLNKLTSGFNDECEMSIQTLDTVFNTLKSSLEARRNALMQQLVQMKTIGRKLLLLFS